jgi:ferredoxin
MHAHLYYYTGTGNSLWVARTLAEALGDAETIQLSEDTSTKNMSKPDCLGLVFPVHIWGVPAKVLKFVHTVTDLQPDYVFAIAVNGGQVANTLVQLKKALTVQSITLAAGWEITMPSNYIPWGGPGPQDQQQTLFEAARNKIAAIAEKIRGKAMMPVETGILWQRLIFSGLVYPMSTPHVPKMDKRFWVDEKCNHCEICQKVCPADNITIQDGKPVWNQRCEQCFACLQWCPQEAIQYGKNTPKYERYHHPEVTIKDVLQSRQ